jgi:hypothetical protein
LRHCESHNALLKFDFCYHHYTCLEFDIFLPRNKFDLILLKFKDGIPD